jgi:hypothetical protein
MRLPIGSPRELPKELPWLGLTAAALLATFAFEHWAVHLLVVIPSAQAGEAPPWAVAAMVLPELVVLFLAGFRLRSVLCIVTVAGIGALLRVGFHVFLWFVGAVGHADARHLPLSEVGLTAPMMGLAYLLVLGLAATMALEERRPSRAPGNIPGRWRSSPESPEAAPRS